MFLKDSKAILNEFKHLERNLKVIFDDVPLERRIMMSKIKGKNTSIEVMCRKYLYSCGFRYRKNVRLLPGTPDIVLKKYKTVIFVNGCFWHHHEGCKKARIPKTHIEYWRNKIDKNMRNDYLHTNQLKKLVWKVVVWECELSKNEFHTSMVRVINEILTPV